MREQNFLTRLLRVPETVQDVVYGRRPSPPTLFDPTERRSKDTTVVSERIFLNIRNL